MHGAVCVGHDRRASYLQFNLYIAWPRMNRHEAAKNITKSVATLSCVACATWRPTVLKWQTRSRNGRHTIESDSSICVLSILFAASPREIRYEKFIESNDDDPRAI